MKSYIGAIIALAFISQAGAQTAAQSRLDEARKELKETQAEYQGMRSALYRDINRLNEEAIKLATELRNLEKEEERRTNKKAALKMELSLRQKDFDYWVGVLGNYSGALLTRIHPAEKQLYKKTLDDADALAGAQSGDMLAELEHRLVSAKTGLERLDMVTGGHVFEGKALRNGKHEIAGTLAVVGPSVFMASREEDFGGVATFAETGTEMATVVSVNDFDSGAMYESVTSGSGRLPLDPTMGKAIMVMDAEESLSETVAKGGVVGYAILALGLVAILLTVFKVLEISRFAVPSRRRVNEIIDDLLSGRDEEAMEKASKVSGMSGELLKTGVLRFNEKRRVLEESLFEKLVVIKPRLERFLPFLGLTAAAAPLMGLLGTVLGIIKTFEAMAIHGSSNQQAFTQGISEALITTAQGLVVAIPVLVLHGIMRSLAKGKFSEIESVAIALMNGTTELDRRSSGSRNPDDTPDDDTELVPNPA